MNARALALLVLALATGLSSLALAAENPKCPVRRFAQNARVQSGELDGLFGKLAPADKPLRVAYVAPSTSEAPLKQTIAGMRAEAGRLGVSVDVTSPEDPLSETQQVAAARRALEGGPDILLVTAIAPATLAPVIAEATSRGVPTVAVGFRADGARTFVGVDQNRLGAMAAEYLHELFPLGATLAQIEGPAGAPMRDERGKGFSDELKFYPNLVVVDSVPADWSRDKAKAATLSLIAAHPEIRGIFANSDALALGAVDALKSLKLNDVAVVGADGTAEARVALMNRSLKGTAARFPAKEGAIAVQAGLRLLACQAIPPWIVSPRAMMTPKSLEDYPASQ